MLAPLAKKNTPARKKKRMNRLVSAKRIMRQSAKVWASLVCVCRMQAMVNLYQKSGTAGGVGLPGNG